MSFSRPRFISVVERLAATVNARLRGTTLSKDLGPHRPNTEALNEEVPSVCSWIERDLGENQQLK